MRFKIPSRALSTALMTSLLSASIAIAEDRSRVERANAQPAGRQQTARKETNFKSDRTDSWLCNNVSVFFCSSLFPTLGESSGNGSPSTTNPPVPDRSRRGD